MHAVNILITGGAGFLGQALCRALLARGSASDASGVERPINRIRLFDIAARPIDDARVHSVTGDLNNPAELSAALTPDTDSIFHLAAVVSGEAEANFDIGMRVNVDGTRALLEACRALPKPPRLVFTSSLAVFGGPLPDPVPDGAALSPQNSYGAQKAMCEFMINDMSRKGMIDGRCLRLPTIAVRPGAPNKAASGFISGIIREPLRGVDAICPADLAMRVWILSPRNAVRNLILGHEIPTAQFTHTRSITVPGMSISLGDMLAALRDVAGAETAARVRVQRDPVIERIVAGWPAAFESTFGRSLGMRVEDDFREVIRAHIEDSGLPAARA